MSLVSLKIVTSINLSSAWILGSENNLITLARHSQHFCLTYILQFKQKVLTTPFLCIKMFICRTWHHCRWIEAFLQIGQLPHTGHNKTLSVLGLTWNQLCPLHESLSKVWYMEQWSDTSSGLTCTKSSQYLKHKNQKALLFSKHSELSSPHTHSDSTDNALCGI